MVVRVTPFRVSDFSGGVNLKVSDEEASRTEARIMSNYTLADDTPDMVKRDGHTQYEVTIPGGQPVAGQWRFYKENGSKYLIAISGANIYAIQDGDGAWTTIGAGLVVASTKHWSFVTWPLTDEVFFVNEDQPAGPTRMFRWDGTMAPASVTQVVTPERFKYIAMHQEKMWALSVDTPSRVYFSAPQDPTNYTNTQNIDNFIGLDTRWGDKTVGLVVNYTGQLMAMKQASKWVLSGYSAQTYDKKPVQTGVGTIAAGTIHHMTNEIMDLTSEGFYMSPGGTFTNYASEKIEPLFNRSLNGGILDRAVGGYIVIVFDEHRSCFYFWESALYNIRSMSVWPNEGNPGEIYFGDDIGRIFKMNDGVSDNGTDISARYTSVAHHMGEPDRYKRYRACMFGIYGNEGILEVPWKVDLGRLNSKLPDINMSSSGSEFDVAKWDQGLWAEVAPSYPSWGFEDDCTGQNISISLNESSQLGPFRVKFYSILYKMKNYHYDRGTT
jgi:hypothetical protein